MGQRKVRGVFEVFFLCFSFFALVCDSFLRLHHYTDPPPPPLLTFPPSPAALSPVQLARAGGRLERELSFNSANKNQPGEQYLRRPFFFFFLSL